MNTEKSNNNNGILSSFYLFTIQTAPYTWLGGGIQMEGEFRGRRYSEGVGIQWDGGIQTEGEFTGRGYSDGTLLYALQETFPFLTSHQTLKILVVY